MSTDTAATLVPRTSSAISAARSEGFVDVFRPFFDRSGMCLASLDPRVRVVEANVDFFRQFGRSATEVCGQSFYDLLHPSVREKVEQQFARLTEGRRVRFAERMVAVRPGEPAFAGELTGIAVHGENGQVESIMVMVRPEKYERDPQVLTGRKKLLTAMDARILEGVASGVSTVQLAAMLYLSRGGVEYHVSTLLRKLKVSNRPALVSKAYSMGIFGVGSWPPRVLPDYVK
ncbi:helix-turn-helix transcriptional regulator [Amycolatopsis saalfeldensis]|uniref:PAS domain S-box-containing protein n=1 Tax=Amycolatopsis saalfeldensis TaxID=394193 RepID=A0A1H8SEX4_9PSEU|nr:PAS and helix-turn-helix domain-containing protein [Amycolatopsis saalfeldensis]SEO77107.1 PAS domain S-box-containing protein [Amycolatopsis saalfeldensis]